MEINERFEKIIKAKGLTFSEFENKCGLSNGYTRNLKDRPSSKKLNDILTAFPDINPLWLMTGEGEMLVGGTNNPVEQHVRGNENKLTVAGGVSETLFKQALDEISEIRTLLCESVKCNNEIARRLMSFLEQK